MLHPDLADLQRRYTEVLDAYEAGNLSYEDAVTTVQSMTVVDGAGFVWAIDTATGEFLRAEPGSPPQPADFSAYQPAQTSRSGGPWSHDNLMQPPERPASQPGFGGHSQPNHGGGPHNPFGDQPGQRPPHEPLDEAFDTMRMGAHPTEQQYAPVDPKAKSLSSADKSIIAKFLPEPVAGFVEKRLRLILVVVGCLVVFFAYQAMTAEPDEGPVPVEPAPTVPGIADGVTGPDTTPAIPDTTIEPEPEPEPEPVQDPVPSIDEQRAGLGGLVSADRAAVDAVVRDSGTAVDVILRTAEYTGYVQTGLTLTIASPAVEDEERVVSNIDLVDTVSGEVVASAVARWVNVDGVWILATYPNFVPVDLDDNGDNGDNDGDDSGNGES